jgi:2'-hydroxyisoflavone reductase
MSNPKNSRRTFVKKALAAGVAIPLIGSSLLSCDTKSEKKSLNILILGGTSFLGPHQVSYAISRGHKVSTFTRGKTKPTIHTEVFDQVEMLIGDRNDNLTALENRRWDVVIDNSGRNVQWTKDTTNLLKDSCGLYLYISSTGVYFPYLTGDIKEDREVLLKSPEGITDEILKMQYDYGVMKANSELEARKAFGADRAIAVRPTYMFGPGDRTDRFTHWPIRLAKGGDVMVPGKKEDYAQYIDVRDVAEWCIRLAEQKAAGTYNAVGPATPTTMYQFIDEAKGTFGKEHNLVYIDDYEFLKTNGLMYLVPWLYVDENHVGSAKVNIEKALKNGLTIRDLKTSIKETHDWWYSDALTQERRNRLEKNPDSWLVREPEILEKWKEYSS